MRIAFTIGNDTAISGLEDSVELVIHDTDEPAEERLPSPSQAVTIGKRLAVIELLMSRDVDLVAAVPDGFCRASHAIAQAAGLRFLPTERGMSPDLLVRHAPTLTVTALDELPASWLAPAAPAADSVGDTAWLSDPAATAILNRLRRLEGQARGVQRLVDQRASLDDILTQVAAMRSALNAVGLTLLAENLATCLTTSEQADDGEERLLAAKRAFQRLN